MSPKRTKQTSIKKKNTKEYIGKLLELFIKFRDVYISKKKNQFYIPAIVEHKDFVKQRVLFIITTPLSAPLGKSTIVAKGEYSSLLVSEVNENMPG